MRDDLRRRLLGQDGPPGGDGFAGPHAVAMPAGYRPNATPVQGEGLGARLAGGGIPGIRPPASMAPAQEPIAYTVPDPGQVTTLPRYNPERPADFDPRRMEADRDLGRRQSGIAGLVGAVPAVAGLIAGPSSAFGSALLGAGAGLAAGGMGMDAEAADAYRRRQTASWDWMQDVGRTQHATDVAQGRLEEAERVRGVERGYTVADNEARAQQQAAQRAAGMIDDVAKSGDAGAIAQVMIAGGLDPATAAQAAQGIAAEYQRRVEREGVQAAQGWARIELARSGQALGWANHGLSRERMAFDQENALGDDYRRDLAEYVELLDQGATPEAMGTYREYMRGRYGAIPGQEGDVNGLVEAGRVVMDSGASIEDAVNAWMEAGVSEDAILEALGRLDG